MYLPQRWILQGALAAAVLMPVACSESSSEGVPAVTPSQSTSMPDDLHDYRFCEVLVTFQDRLTINNEVYNTLGFNDCPADLWGDLNVEAMAESYGAKTVDLNGPRHLVMNKLVLKGESLNGKIADFGGIEMRNVATSRYQLRDLADHQEFYGELKLHRSTVYTYDAGTRVYELTSPEGTGYVMTSYSQLIDPDLSMGDLAGLGDRLDLPEGWTYQARVLEEVYEPTTDGVAYALIDDLGNAYQRRGSAAEEASGDEITPEEVPGDLVAEISNDTSSARGVRTCELYELRIDGEFFVLDIWNNRDMHDCPDEWLAQIDESSFYVGGPRWRTVDLFMAIDENGEPADASDMFGEDAIAEIPAGLGLDMALAATVTLVEASKIERRDGIEVTTLDDVPAQTRQLLLGSTSAKPYEIQQVDRLAGTLIRYLAGEPVYTLDDGRCTYAMKYFTSKLNRSITDASALVGLGAEMAQVPDGWTYEIRTFDEDAYIIDTDNKQFVVEDEFGNSYDLLWCK